MTISKPIPSKLVVRGQSAVVVYKGQVRTCFSCGSTGHENRVCPVRRARLLPPGPQVSGGVGSSALTSTAGSVVVTVAGSATTAPVFTPISSTVLTPPAVTTVANSVIPVVVSQETGTSPAVLPSVPVVEGSGSLDPPGGGSVPVSGLGPLDPPGGGSAPVGGGSDPSDPLEGGSMDVGGFDHGGAWTLVTHRKQPGKSRANPVKSAEVTVTSEGASGFDPYSRKRTLPAIVTSTGGRRRANSDVPPPDVSVGDRDRSPLRMSLTASGQLKFSEIVVQGPRLPNPTYMASDDLTPQESELLTDLHTSDNELFD